MLLKTISLRNRYEFSPDQGYAALTKYSFYLIVTYIDKILNLYLISGCIILMNLIFLLQE